jgi:hypothetical protein
MSTSGKILTQQFVTRLIQQFQGDKEALKMKFEREGTAMTNQHEVDFEARKKQFRALIMDFNKFQVNPANGSYEFSVARAAMCTAYETAEKELKVNRERELARLQQKYVRDLKELEANHLQAITAITQAQNGMDRD